MIKLTVEIEEGAYPVYIGSGLSGKLERVIGGLLSDEVLVVTNTTVEKLYLRQVLAGLPEVRVSTVIIEDGEQYKTIETMGHIVTQLLQNRFSRTCTLLALGGGVIGDVTGFAAACYQRGVGYVQLPTTLLAQVDSAVGGKTAVNHALGKNMIGAFHQPLAVISDIDVLASLPEREFRAGMAEVIKYGLIGDSDFFIWLEENMEALLGRKREALIHAIATSCRNKADVVAEDEHEAGLRALLNLGHTFGHAIEAALHYRDWLHGEAVATGMLMAASLSTKTTGLTNTEVARIEALLKKVGLPVRLPASIQPGQLREWMAVDKKTRFGRLHLILLEGIGKAVVTSRFSEEDLTATIARYAANP